MALSHELMLIYTTYFVATASPGPSNMAIMGTAMKPGRGAALSLAGGVIGGSMLWALKMGGGLYLLWLASVTARFIALFFTHTINRAATNFV